MSNEIFLHPRIGRVEVKINRRSKRVSIAVMPSGDVRLNIPYGGSAQNALSFLESREGWIAATRERLTAEAERQRLGCQAVVNAKSTPEDLGKLWLDAHSYLPKRIAEIARSTNLEYSELKIGRAMGRWGSCSTRNTINLSMYIMGLPPHLIDFVIIHELCHTQHHNHSPKFHALVDKMTGGREKELERELKGWRISMR
ncbi:MAG: YgjP-like metallopeptidase domain-containing protein [Rikenellaceae bacterium]